MQISTRIFSARGDNYNLNRLVGITEIFQGDNNMEADRAVLREQIGYKIVWY